MDMASLDLAQHILIAGATKQFRGKGDGQVAIDDRETVRGDGLGGSEGRLSVNESNGMNKSLYPIRYCHDGIFVRQPALRPELVHPYIVEGQAWKNVMSTWSMIGSMKKLFKDAEPRWYVLD